MTNAGEMNPESPSSGTILQRGGEELAIAKVSDRFTVQPASRLAAASLAQQITAQGMQLVGTIATAQSAELTVAPAQRDQVMQQLRNLEEVNFASHVYQLQNQPGTLLYLTDEVTIQFAAPVDVAAGEAIATAAGLEKVKAVAGIPNTFVFRLTAQATENPIKLTNRLMQRSEVLTAEPNIVIKAQAHYTPRDPFYPRQWYLNHNGGADLAPGSHLSVPQAWERTRGDRSVVIAVIDDSFDLNHPDLQGPGKVVAPRDFKDGDTLPLPSTGEGSHGTSCAGIAIAEENGIGIVGVAPGCAFMPIRTSGYLDDATVEQVFNWAIDRGATVISCSWGPSAVYFPLSLRQRAVLTRATTVGRNGKGCVVVFAAGNANRPLSGTVNEPTWTKNVLSGPTKWLMGFTTHPDVVVVSACTSLGKKAAYSNWGEHITVCAPSNNAPPGFWLDATGFVSTPPEITATLPGQSVFTIARLNPNGGNTNYTDNFGGTSSACPMVAGVAGLILSVNPDLKAAEVRQILQQTADKIVDSDPDPQLGLRQGTYEANGHSAWFGYGRVNAFRAVEAAQQRAQATVSPTRQIQLQNAAALAIPDYDIKGATSLIQVADSGTIREIQIQVSVEHSFLGDLALYLIAPTGQSFLLQNRTLGRRTSLEVTYTLQTTPLLQQLLQQPAQGAWQLQAIDYAMLNTGNLNRWQLTLGIG